MLDINISPLEVLLQQCKGVLIACSGGIDSLLLAVTAHRTLGRKCHVVHSVGPSVPSEATERVKTFAEKEGWRLHLISSEEFQDENYLSNPLNRCFFCKTHLYRSLSFLSQRLLKEGAEGFSIMSGTNCDDLSEYRPGLIAADQFGVRHPYVEAGMGKEDIRSYARQLELSFSELPSSPCLSSRIYTGTRVTPERLQAIHFSETILQNNVPLKMVRCRLEEDEMRIEVLSSDREKLTTEVLSHLREQLQSHHPLVRSVSLDPGTYRPGRAFRALP